MEHLRYEYDLNRNGVVFDLGCYEGTFTKRIREKYGCKIYAFEPISKFYELVKNLESEDVKVFNFGIGATTRSEMICVRNDASSIFLKGEESQLVEVRDLEEVMRDLNVDYVDLIKINVEGCEYEILDKIIESHIAHKFDNIQVQFHSFFENAVQRREKIREGLAKTHKITYDYPFIWENHKKI